MHRRIFTLFSLLAYGFLPLAPGERWAAAAPGPLSQDGPLPGIVDPLVSDAQSTSGPLPGPAGMAPESGPASPEAVVIPDVPAYLWRHGCGPTAAGMVIGYWDLHGYDWLVPGEASSQTAGVNEMMASSQSPASHYTDYAHPEERYPGALKPDRSEAPAGDEHTSDSLADFMNTSWSARGNYYGWSWFSDMGRSLQGYVNHVKPAGFEPVTENLYMFDGSLSWDRYRAEIDAGRPVVLLVDTEGDGVTDHFITAIGYDEQDGARLYAAFHTWDRQVHWYEFRPLSKGAVWGIFGGTTFRIDPTGEDETLDICLVDEPESLYLYSQDLDLSAALILSAIYDGPIDHRSYAHQPVILQALPDFDNGLAVTQTVTVYPGEPIVDAEGRAASLAPGVVYLPTGCRSAGCAETYSEGIVAMDRVQSVFPLIPGLAWSDGQPLTARDSVYSFQLSASPDTPDAWMANKALVERTESYYATGPAEITWTGLPGYLPSDLALFFWTPLPEHIWSGYTPTALLSDKISRRQPLGWGPYRIESWEPASPITLQKNPYYFRSEERLPAFERLVFHFSLDPLQGLLSGACDIAPELSTGLETLQEYDRRGWLKLFITELQLPENFPAGETRMLVAAAAPSISAFDLDPTEWRFWNIETVRLGTDGTIPAEGGELFSPDDLTRYTFSPGAFSGPVTLTHTARSPLSLPLPRPLPSALPRALHSALTGIGHYFESTAADGEAQTAVLAQPYTLSVQYTEAELGRVRENTLGLYYWTGLEWMREPTSRVAPETNTLTASPSHFGLWAALGLEGQLVFFPQVGAP